MEQNVARSRTCGEVLWCEVRFFFRVFSRVFLRHPFLHIREVSLFCSSLLSSFLVCPPPLSSSLLFSFLPFPSLPFPSLSPSPPPFPLRRKHNHKHNHKYHHTLNTEPPTYKIPPRPPYIPSHQPLKKPQSYLHIPPKTKNIPQQQNTIYTYLQVHVPTTYMFSTYITKQRIALQPSQQTLLQQDCRVTFSGSSGSSCVRKSQSIYCTCNHTYVFFSFFILLSKREIRR